MAKKFGIFSAFASFYILLISASAFGFGTCPSGIEVVNCPPYDVIRAFPVAVVCNSSPVTNGRASYTGKSNCACQFGVPPSNVKSCAIPPSGSGNPTCPSIPATGAQQTIDCPDCKVTGVVNGNYQAANAACQNALNQKCDIVCATAKSKPTPDPASIACCKVTPASTDSCAKFMSNSDCTKSVNPKCYWNSKGFAGFCTSVKP